jgi:hypothetical protein
VWLIRLRTSIGRVAGLVVPSGCQTTRLAYSGRYLETGASTSSLPSSTRVMAVTETIGLVIEKTRKMVSSETGVVWCGPWTPKPSW